MAAVSGVKSVEANITRTLFDTVPSDQFQANQWYFRQIGAYRAWDVRTNASPIVVAVIDDGIQLNHPDFFNLSGTQSNIWRNGGEIAGNNVDDDFNGYRDDVNGWDFASNDNNPNPNFVGGAWDTHGTHVAGSIGAVGNNNRGTAGMAWNVQLMPLKIFNGGGTSLAAVVNAVVYGVDNGADIMNMSYGGPSFSAAEDAAMLYASNAGVLCVVAAGNSQGDNDNTPQYPASYTHPNILAVAATNFKDQLTDFSCYGKNSVDIGTPGLHILSTIVTGPQNAQVRTHEYFSGTSMASPITAGAAALVMAQYPSLGALGVKQRLLQTADRVSGLTNLVSSGGRLNIARALGQAYTVPPNYAMLSYQNSAYAWSWAYYGYTYDSQSSLAYNGALQAYFAYYYATFADQILDDLMSPTGASYIDLPNGVGRSYYLGVRQTSLTYQYYAYTYEYYAYLESGDPSFYYSAYYSYYAYQYGYLDYVNF